MLENSSEICFWKINFSCFNIFKNNLETDFYFFARKWLEIALLPVKLPIFSFSNTHTQVSFLKKITKKRDSFVERRPILRETWSTRLRVNNRWLKPIKNARHTEIVVFSWFSWHVTWKRTPQFPHKGKFLSPISTLGTLRSCLFSHLQCVRWSCI